MKNRDASWAWLTATAMDARDVLRSRFAPTLRELAGRVGGAEGERLAELARLAGAHADRLRLAIKRRQRSRAA